MKWTMIPMTMFEQDSDLPPLGYEVLDDTGATVFHDQTYYPQAPTPEQAARIVHCVNNQDALLAALECLLWYAEDCASDREEYPSCLGQARAAIAAAKGEA